MECGVPWSTLKDHISRHTAENIGMEKDMPADIPKLGRALVLPKLVELRLVKYIIKGIVIWTKCGPNKTTCIPIIKRRFHKLSI
jgi:hypothetical protein